MRDWITRLSARWRKKPLTAAEAIQALASDIVRDGVEPNVHREFADVHLATIRVDRTDEGLILVVNGSRAGEVLSLHGLAWASPDDFELVCLRLFNWAWGTAKDALDPEGRWRRWRGRKARP